MPAALALSAAFLFAAALITTQFGLRHMDALAGAKVSVPSATLLFWLVLLLRGADLGGWQPQAAGIFLALGLLFPAAVTLLAYEANRRMGPTIAGAIGSTAPLFAVLGAVVFLGERLGVTQVASTVAIVAGSIVLVWRNGATLRGVGLISWVSWAAAALRALAQVVVKAGLLLWPNPYAATLLCYSVSTAVIWTVGALSRRPESRVYHRRGVIWFGLTGLFNGTAVLTLYSALETGAVSVVSPIAATYPLFTLVLNSGILRQERLSARLIAGVLLMVSGVVALVYF
ncbi:MAG: DMT family transporter [Betaproteobacteria bacterium]|nr:DMT family transporter [Betaproteobacteria bacterium]